MGTKAAATAMVLAVKAVTRLGARYLDVKKGHSSGSS